METKLKATWVLINHPWLPYSIKAFKLKRDSIFCAVRLRQSYVRILHINTGLVMVDCKDMEAATEVMVLLTKASERYPATREAFKQMDWKTTRDFAKGLNKNKQAEIVYRVVMGLWHVGIVSPSVTKQIGFKSRPEYL